MRIRNLILTALAVAAALEPCHMAGQQSLYQQIRAHNTRMTEVQPSWMAPLIQSDSRLSQAIRFSVSNYTTGPAHPIDYGNNHGITAIVQRRLQFDLDPPNFVRNHATGLSDGFTNLGAQVKVRIASGNADHHNYALSAILFHGFAPRAYRNFALSSYYSPSIAAGKGFGRVAVLTTVGGWLPTAKVTQQGRTIDWNLTGQLRVSPHAWIDVENNFTHFLGASIDGHTQNMITPAAFYMIRRKGWKPEHAAFVVDGGMQMATSGFHTFNHNVITELRVLF